MDYFSMNRWRTLERRSEEMGGGGIGQEVRWKNGIFSRENGILSAPAAFREEQCQRPSYVPQSSSGDFHGCFDTLARWSDGEDIPGGIRVVRASAARGVAHPRP